MTLTYSDYVPNPSYTATRLISQSVGSQVSTTTFDGLGRVINKSATSDPEGTDKVDTIYDAVGNVYSVSNPYRSTSNGIS